MSGFNIARPFHPRLHESFGILRREGKKFPHLSGVQTLGDCSLRRRELILSKGRVSEWSSKKDVRDDTRERDLHQKSTVKLGLRSHPVRTTIAVKRMIVTPRPGEGRDHQHRILGNVWLFKIPLHNKLRTKPYRDTIS